VAFFRRWKYLFPAMFLTATLFIGWDAVFTAKGIWGFTPRHLSGISWLHLPLEEILFFFVIPYASIFTFDVVLAYFKTGPGPRTTRILNLTLLALSMVMILAFAGRLYTLTTFLLLALLLVWLQWIGKPEWSGHFYLSFMFVLLPFLLVNGALTGSGVEEEVVWYNDAENLGLRIGTIPFEDVFYGLDLILLNVILYKFFQGSGVRA
jgi:lycopene cyclase domain-containing protein